MPKIARLFAVLAVFVPALASAADAPYDLVLRNARIVDGTGSPWYRGDIAIRGDTIARIAPAITEPAKRVIDVRDLVVAPGFIDIHTHAGAGLFKQPTAENYIRQGVTTIIEGPDGAGPSIMGSPPSPIKPYLDKLEALPKSINIGSFTGQGAVRTAVVGLENRAATPEEIERMKAMVLQDMKDGALGLSTGLFYIPGAFTPLAEIVELQKVVAPFRGVHTSHMRSEGLKVVESVRETIAIGEQAGVPTHVTHHKIVGRSNAGKSVETLRLIDEARARGVDVTLDMYPYTASATSIHGGLLPKWALEGGFAQTRARLRDPATRAKLKAELARSYSGAGRDVPASTVVAFCRWNPSLAGQSVTSIAQSRGLAPDGEGAAETVIWLVENGSGGANFHTVSEEDLPRILAHPATMIASDGWIPEFGVGVPHPRTYGTFARVLGVYVREKGVITLEDAVRKMSSYPAARLGLVDRGVLRPGMKADISVFDPRTVKDLATYEKPHQYAVGVEVVVVNGRVVVEGGKVALGGAGRVVFGVGRKSD